MRATGARVKKTGSRGQALVEFALILLLILALLFGIAEFGRGWHYVNAVTNGARAGARFASLQPVSDDATFTADVRNYTFGQVASAVSATPNVDLFVNISAHGSSGAARTSFGNLSSGDAVSVIVRYDFEVLTGSIIPFFKGPKPIVRRATMRFEQGS